MYERVGECVISVCKRTFKGPTDAFMIVKETRKCPGLVIYFENTLHLQQLKLGSWAGWKNYNRYKHARSRGNAHRLYKIPAKSPGMRIDFAYNFSSVTYPAPPLSVSRSQHSHPFEMFSFSSIHSNILSPLVQRSFYQGSLQRASCRYDSAGFLKPRGEPGSTLLRGRSNERVLVRLHAGSLLYWEKTRAENRG